MNEDTVQPTSRLVTRLKRQARSLKNQRERFPHAEHIRLKPPAGAAMSNVMWQAAKRLEELEEQLAGGPTCVVCNHTQRYHEGNPTGDSDYVGADGCAQCYQNHLRDIRMGKGDPFDDTWKHEFKPKEEA